MGPLDVLIHLLNFAAPAFGIALLMLAFTRVFKGKAAPGLNIYAQAAINFIVGLLVLVLGLWVFGRDGMIATYAALVLMVASSQWLMERGWRT